MWCQVEASLTALQLACGNDKRNAAVCKRDADRVHTELPFRHLQFPSLQVHPAAFLEKGSHFFIRDITFTGRCVRYLVTCE
jgi:hypothetical protein